MRKRKDGEGEEELQSELFDPVSIALSRKET